MRWSCLVVTGGSGVAAFFMGGGAGYGTWVACDSRVHGSGAIAFQVPVATRIARIGKAVQIGRVTNAARMMSRLCETPTTRINTSFPGEMRYRRTPGNSKTSIQNLSVFTVF